MTKDEKNALSKIAGLGCILCSEVLGIAGSPAELHHVRRYGAKRSASPVLPLCPEHHRGNNGVHGLDTFASQNPAYLKKVEQTPHNVRRGIDADKVKRVIVFSDAHFTDSTTTAFKALLLMIDTFKPEVIICNGDAFDGQVLSRFPSINYDQKPTVLEELKACQYHLDEIVKHKPPGCELIWTLGNHDMRYESWLVNKVPEYSGVDGFSLKYHFPEWKTCWSYWIGENTVVKHRYKGGRTAGYSNLTAAGMYP